MEIKWGIIGCGRIASKFAHDLALVDGNVLHAVASRNVHKAKDFAEENGATVYYGSYKALCEDDQVDIVYVATVHSFHLSVGLEVMEAGKHLLCEKPLGINKDEVEQLVNCAQRNNVFLMEAMWSRFNPCIQEAYNRVKNGEIGEVNYINADFYFISEYDRSHRLFNPDLAGGALLDIGVYPLFLSYIFLGMPNNIVAKSRLVDDCVDLQTSVILDYDNAQSVLSFGFQTRSDMRGCINGTSGNIQLLDRWHESTEYILIQNEDSKLISVPRIGLGYVHEMINLLTFRSPIFSFAKIFWVDNK